MKIGDLKVFTDDTTINEIIAYGKTDAVTEITPESLSIILIGMLKQNIEVYQAEKNKLEIFKDEKLLDSALANAQKFFNLMIAAKLPLPSSIYSEDIIDFITYDYNYNLSNIEGFAFQLATAYQTSQNPENVIEMINLTAHKLSQSQVTIGSAKALIAVLQALNAIKAGKVEVAANYMAVAIGAVRKNPEELRKLKAQLAASGLLRLLKFDEAAQMSETAFYNALLKSVAAFNPKLVPDQLKNYADKLYQGDYFDIESLQTIYKSYDPAKEYSAKELMYKQSTLRAIFKRASKDDGVISHICENLKDYHLTRDDILNDKVLHENLKEKSPVYFDKFIKEERELEVGPHLQGLASKIEKRIGELLEDKDFVERDKEKIELTRGETQVFVASTARELYKDLSIEGLKKVLEENKAEDTIEYRMAILEVILSKNPSKQEIVDILENLERFHLNADAVLSREVLVEKLKSSFSTDEFINLLKKANNLTLLEKFSTDDDGAIIASHVNLLLANRFASQGEYEKAVSKYLVKVDSTKVNINANANDRLIDAALEFISGEILPQRQLNIVKTQEKQANVSYEKAEVSEKAEKPQELPIPQASSHKRRKKKVRARPTIIEEAETLNISIRQIPLGEKKDNFEIRRAAAKLMFAVPVFQARLSQSDIVTLYKVFETVEGENKTAIADQILKTGQLKELVSSLPKPDAVRIVAYFYDQLTNEQRIDLKDFLTVEQKLSLIEKISSEDKDKLAILNTVIEDEEFTKLGLEKAYSIFEQANGKNKEMAAKKILSMPNFSEKSNIEQLKVLIRSVDAKEALDLCKNYQGKDRLDLITTIIDSDIMNNIYIGDQIIGKGDQGEDVIREDGKGRYFKDLGDQRKIEFYSNWLTGLALSGDELITLCNVTKQEKIAKAIKSDRTLSKKFVEASFANFPQKETGAYQLIIALLKEDKRSDVYKYNPELIQKITDKITLEEISDIVGSSISPMNKILILSTAVKYNAADNFDRNKKRIEVYLRHMDVLRESDLVSVINSYKRVVISGKADEKNVVLSFLNAIFDSSHMTNTLLDKIDKDCLSVFVDYCIENAKDKWAQGNLNKIVNYACLNDIHLVSIMINHCVANAKEKWSQDILSKIMDYAYNQADPKLVVEINRKLTKECVPQYIDKFLKVLNITETSDDFYSGLQIQNILTDPVNVAQLNDKDFSYFVNMYQKICELLTVNEYHEMIKLSKEQYAKNNKEMAIYYSEKAEKNKKFAAAVQVEGILQRLKDKNEDNKDPDSKAKVDKILTNYISSEIKKKNTSILMDALSDFLGINIDKLMGQENLIADGMKIAIGFAYPGEKIFDANKNSLGIMQPDGRICDEAGKFLYQADIKVGTPLYNKKGEFLGTLTANSNIEFEVLIDSNVAINLLMDRSIFREMGQNGDKTKHNKLFRRIISSKSLSEFLDKVRGNNNKEEIMTSFIDYLLENNVSLSGRPDWDKVWKVAVECFSYDKLIQLFNDCFPLIVGTELKDDAKTLLLYMLRNDSHVQKLVETKDNKIDLMQMLERVGVEEIEKYLSDSTIANSNAKNLLNVFLLSKKEYVNKFFPKVGLNNALIPVSEFDTYSFTEKVKNLKIENLPEKFIMGLDKRVREQIIKNMLSVDPMAVDMLKKMVESKAFGWEMILKCANENSSYKQNLAWAILSDEKVAEGVYDKMHALLNTHVEDFRDVFLELLNSDTRELFTAEGKLSAKIFPETDQTLATSRKAIIKDTILLRWNNLKLSPPLINYILARPSEKKSDSIYRSVVSDSSKMESIIDAAAEQKLTNIFYKIPGVLRRKMRNYIPMFINKCKNLTGLTHEQGNCIRTLEADFRDSIMKRESPDPIELLINFRNSDDKATKIEIINRLFTDRTCIDYLRSPTTHVATDLFAGFRKFLGIKSGDPMTNFGGVVNAINELTKFVGEEFSNDNMEKCFKTLGGHGKGTVSKSNLETVKLLSDFLHTKHKYLAKSASTKDQKKISKDAGEEAAWKLNESSKNWWSKIFWNFKKTLTGGYQYVADGVVKETAVDISKHNSEIERLKDLVEKGKHRIVEPVNNKTLNTNPFAPKPVNNEIPSKTTSTNPFAAEPVASSTTDLKPVDSKISQSTNPFVTEPVKPVVSSTTNPKLVDNKSTNPFDSQPSTPSKNPFDNISPHNK